MTQATLALYVNKRAENALAQRHPWVFEAAITKQSREGSAGDVVVLFNSRKQLVGVGLYDPFSLMRVKVLSHSRAQINDEWFAGALQAAFARRAPLFADAHTTGFRLVHGENDGLPALILDRYADTLVLKVYSAIWFPYLLRLGALLRALLPHERVVLRLARNVQALAAAQGRQDGDLLQGSALPDSELLFLENGLTFAADVRHGHKTGFFFDQRDNRQLASQYADGRSVLDVFSYNGGFGVYAARGGAHSVTSLDMSAPSLASAAANMARNRLLFPNDVRFTPLQGDAFAHLDSLADQRKAFGLVIIDPPAFAKQQREVDGALRAYERLAALGARLVEAGGTLVLASCSSRVHSDAFFNAVQRGIRTSGRTLKELTRTFHPLDHPISYPEGAYLKCWFGQA